MSLLAVLGLACAPATEGAGGLDSAGDGGGQDADDGDDPSNFGKEAVFEVRLNDDVPPPLMLEMTRAEVAELFGSTADEVLLLELDSGPLFTNSLEAIKAACGMSWALDNADPQHDCSLTELGQSFEGPDGTWQTSAEYSLVRILTMTPANVVVEGTSSESLRSLSDALDVGGGYSQILAEALGIPRTAPVVSTAALVQSFQDNFAASHPGVGDDAALRFYLSDALSDLATMADRYGEQDGHPGVIDPSFVPHGEVFGPDFRMKAAASSNLRLVDGVDADIGKGFMSVVADEVGPNYHDEAEFDFNDPAKFELTGIVADLTVDLRFQLLEHDEFVWSCLGNPPCQQNLPGSPADNGSVWANKPWTLEYNIAAGALNDYEDRTFDGGYLLNTAKVQIGQNGNPPGWLEYDIPFGLGSPPEPQYVWETVLEVAQVALHNTAFATFPEGGADVGFTLRDVPVGLTGEQAAEAVRPYLQAQSSKLSDFLLGDFRKNNDYLDFYYQRAENGVPYIFFVAQGDLRDGEPYTYARPGFYSTSSLDTNTKVSDKTVVGLIDTTHEKLEIPVGETVVYFEDDGGTVYRARFVRHSADSSDLEVGIARKL